MRVGSLFSGIGGMDLGLERAGHEVIWQVELDSYARKVLSERWPTAQQFVDVREVGGHNLEPVDLVCGGFPCQDISYAGKGAGIQGEQSGLWSEFYRVICELRPHYVLVENVSALLRRGIDVVLGNLAAIGYDAEWQSLPAAAFGAPHLRDRVFVLAYPHQLRLEADAHNLVLLAPFERCPQFGSKAGREAMSVWDQPAPSVTESCGMVDGIPNRVHRLRVLGNAVVPQVAQWIGERLMEISS